MKVISDKLTVIFDNSVDNMAGISIFREVNGKTVVLKAEIGEQAETLYYLLTNQMAKARIKAESKK